MQHRPQAWAILFALALSPGCIALDGDVGNLPTASDTGDESGTETAATGETGETGEAPMVHVHVRANDTAFDHQDGYAGQTPSVQVFGFRSLQLMTGRNDPAPVLIFDHGTDFVEASYAPGADTIVGSAAIAGLPAQDFSYARVTVSHVRMTIDATMHAMGLDLPGSFDISMALGGDVQLEGETRAIGWWKYVFNAGTTSFPLEGSNGGPPIGAAPGAPIEVVVEGDETVFYFPVVLSTDPGVPGDVDMVMDFNVDQSFRWADEINMGYAAEVFDATPNATEMIWRIGANDYEVYND